MERGKVGGWRKERRREDGEGEEEGDGGREEGGGIRKEGSGGGRHERKMKRSNTVVHTSRPHIVQVVSMLEAPRMFGSVSFQSNEVSGAQNSEFLF